MIFFSICIPATRRHKTIFSTLVSIARQTTRNFECIVTVGKFDTKTIREIERFFLSDFFENNHFDYKLITERDSYISELEEWNEPVKLARGKYIAMLEGDDAYSTDYLKIAHDVLSLDSSIGLYCSRNQNREIDFHDGKTDSKLANNAIYQLRFTPPPSQTIFTRLDEKKQPFYYTIDQYVYSPEIELYRNVTHSGFNVYNDKKNLVIRHISTNPNKGILWFHHQDACHFVNKFRHEHDFINVVKASIALRSRMWLAIKKSLKKGKLPDHRLLLEMLSPEVFMYLLGRKYKYEVTAVKILFNFKNEGNIDFFSSLKYFFNNSRLGMKGLFPNKIYSDFDKYISIDRKDGLWLAKYKDIEIYYDGNLEKERVRIVLSSILNEQSYDLSNSSPHQYLSIDEVHSNDIIYDVGAAEGYQSKVWSKKAKKIVVFEPDPKQINCLNKTFIKEISSGKIIIIPFGVSNFTGQKLIFGQEYQFATLKDLIRKFSLPLPTIIKADIEGHEMQLLQGAKDILTNGSVRIVQITTYHRPNDEYDIPNYLSKFGGVGKFSDGTIYFNRTFDNYTNLLMQEQYEQLFQPVFRKCLYTHWFKS